MVKYDITLGGLAALVGGPVLPSPSTLSRLVNNQLSKDYRFDLNSKLAKTLPSFLFDKGLDKARIDNELLSIFERGEYQPMISKRLELTREAQAFFGLDDDPFSRAPQSREEVFISKDLKRVFDRVIDAIQYQGFVFVEGEIGSGKSTLRALVEDHLFEHANLQIVWPEFFDMRNVTPLQIAGAILEHFGLTRTPRHAVRMGNAVKDLLSRLYKDGKRVSLGFDEAHRLADPALSSLKNFLEMSSGGFQRYLGVLLFGQPVFSARLTDPRFREILERVTVIPMPDFSASSAEYLDHRLRITGGSLELFDKEAVELICRQATTPLQIGNIANEALTISMRDFKNKKVIGSAIKTKMFFENRTQGFKLRKAS